MTDTPAKTPEEITRAIGFPGLAIRKAENDGSYRVSTERDHNNQHWSHSVALPLDPTDQDIANARRSFEEWWDDVRRS